MKIKLQTFSVRVDVDRAFPQDVAESLAMEGVKATVANSISKLNKGQNVDGGDLRRYSSAYEDAIALAMEGSISRGPNKGRVRPLRRKGGSTTPNLRLSGDLHESRQATRITNGAEARFEGTGRDRKISNAELASIHVRRGYTGWQGFGEDDMERIRARAEEELRRGVIEAFSITKTP